MTFGDGSVYSVNSSKKEYDLRTGVLNVSSCLPHTPPVFLSFPHFYTAENYSNAVRVLKPITDQHSSYMTFQNVKNYIKRCQV